jgi:hypothetical protein
LGQSKVAVPHLIIAAVVFGVRLAVLGGLGGGTDPYQSIGSDLQILGAYTRNLVWSFAWVAPSTHAIWWEGAGLLVVGLSAGVRALPRRQSALAATGLTWITGIGVFAVIFHVATVGWIAYFALPGVAILWAAGLEGAVERVLLRASTWWQPRIVCGLLLVGLSGLGASWLMTSPLVKSYRQWQVAGDVSTRYLDALNACVAGAPKVTHLRLEEMPSVLDDGSPETGQMGVTLFEDHTIQSALRLLFPERNLTFIVWSRRALRSENEEINFSCSTDGARVILSASYS